MKNFLKNFCYWIVSSILIVHSVYAQKKDLTMQEAVLGIGIKTLKQLQWHDDQSASYIDKKDSIDTYMLLRVPDCVSTPLFNLTQLNQAVQVIGWKDYKSMPKMHTTSSGKYYIEQNGKYAQLFIDNNGLRANKLYELPDGAENIFIHPITLNAAYTYQYNLYYHNGLEPIAITKDGNKDLLYGTSVHRDEFGIDHGIFWNEDGSALAYYRMDQSMVDDYPIIDWTTGTSRNIKYPMAGKASHQVSLWTYNLKTNRSVQIETREPLDKYITCVTWHPDNKKIFATLVNREQNESSLNRYDAETGAFEITMINENHPKYVEPSHDLIFIPSRPEEFLWWSQKDGYWHLYWVNQSTRKVKALTQGEWMVNDVLGYNLSQNELIITSTYNTPLEKNIYAVDLDKGNIRKINSVNGIHNALLNKSGTYILDNYSNGDIPFAIDLLSVTSDAEKRIFTAEDKSQNYNMSQVRNVTLKASDKTKLYGKLMLPHNFDSTKKYPTIVYLYNGPHLQLVQNKFPASLNLWHDYLTQRGYIVFVMDGRGSSNRGFEFESVTFRKLGQVEMEDQMKGVEYLKSLSYVDDSRLGLFGWSFGGFMTTSIMLTYPEVFKAAVAGGPVMDWSKYEVMYTERYMDTPAENPDGYNLTKTTDKVKNLKGKLMIIHGTDDDVVVWQHSNIFLKSCVDNGVQVDYFTYPGHSHNVRGRDRIHLMQKITDYFDLHLK